LTASLKKKPRSTSARAAWLCWWTIIASTTCAIQYGAAAMKFLMSFENPQPLLLMLVGFGVAALTVLMYGPHARHTRAERGESVSHDRITVGAVAALARRGLRHQPPT
jgi:undecaprenyl pyrophosphate phosphatase UppP